MSSSLPDIDFTRIVPRGGSQYAAFEELCCHLAQEGHPDHRGYQRLRGAGGDGGVECRLNLANGRLLGLQTKYVHKIDPALKHAEKSFRTALQQHPDLTDYIVCLPMDPTGKTARKSRSGQEKIADWIAKRKADAHQMGRRIQIEFWTESSLRDRLLQLPRPDGAIRYYFDQTLLSEEWWSNHRTQAIAFAGPRYTPKSSVETTPTTWFHAFGRTDAWKTELRERLTTYSEATRDDLKELRTAASQPPLSSDTEADGWSPAWPRDALPTLSATVAQADLLRSGCDGLSAAPNETEKKAYEGCVGHSSRLLDNLRALESILAADLDRRHFPGASTSPRFRQQHAEWAGALPADNLDRVRRILESTETLHDWLHSPECFLAFDSVLFLTGPAGVGKTHSLCDTLDSRAKANLPTLMLFGHQLDPARSLDAQLAANLALPHDLPISTILDLLEAEGQTDSAVVLLCIDAVDEAQHRHRWPDEISRLVSLLGERPHVRLCVTCRTPFSTTCLPSGHENQSVEHPGFGDMDRATVHRYLDHYRLRPPTTPLLPPEFSNPLYLRLICEAAQAQDLDSIPPGWFGIQTGIAEYLRHKEREISRHFDTEPAARTLSACLLALAESGDGGTVELSRSEAASALAPVLDGRGCGEPGRVLDWLVRADLLIEDATPSPDPLSTVTRLRFGFARLGDFLRARQILDAVSESLPDAAAPGGSFHNLWSTGEKADHNRDVIAALSVIVPETHPGREVPDLISDPEIRHAVLCAWCDSLSSRDPCRYSEATALLAREALRSEEYAYRTMDALLANCWRRSCLDIHRISRLLRRLPMARRDASWSVHLHESYERHGAARRLIEAILSPTPLHLKQEETERWATALLWFTAAADGRVRDHATRAAILLLRAYPDCIESLLESFLDCDDDIVRERTLLSVYGALLALRDPARATSVASLLRERFLEDPTVFDNAAIRDLLRCLVDLANHLRKDTRAISTDGLDRKCSESWNPEIPTDDECKQYRICEFFQPVEHLSDFVKYTLGALRRWEKHMSRREMGRWMVQYISEDLGYERSDCHHYDTHIVEKYGPGRSKPAWAERIGKKYQWIAMQRLASRLHDHVTPEKSWWRSSSISSPPILPNRRLFDPTIRTAEPLPAETSGSRIVEAHIEAASRENDADWLKHTDDLPKAHDLLALTDESGADWWPLLVYWHGEKPGSADRQRWIHVFAYIVESNDCARALQFLSGRNFYGKWMPEGLDLAGFVAEYPWASEFSDVRGDRSRYAEQGGFGQEIERSSVRFEPAWNRIYPDHEYDATTSESAAVTVPSPTVFDSGDLSWDFRGGYMGADGRTVFREPVGSGQGAAQLVAEPAALQRLLVKTGKRLLWTLLGEKTTGKPGSRTGWTVSQVAYLDEDGALRVGRRLFLDYGSATAAPGFRNRFVRVKR